MNMETRYEDGVAILTLSGSFDANQSAPVRRWVEEVIAGGRPNIIFNLNRVQYIDLVALSILMKGKKSSRDLSGDLKLCSLGQELRIVFETLHLHSVFEIYSTEEEAIQAFHEILPDPL